MNIEQITPFNNETLVANTLNSYLYVEGGSASPNSGLGQELLGSGNFLTYSRGLLLVISRPVPIG